MSASLTRRELEVVRHLAAGLSLREAAAVMWISPSTARHHSNAARTKVGARTAAHMVAIAYRLGLLGEGTG